MIKLYYDKKGIGNMRKIFGITTFIIVLLVSFLGITYSYEYNENNSLKFELLGSYELELELDSKYIEYGVKVTNNGKDISSLVKIDTSLLDMSKVGDYKVKYELDVDGNKEYIYRIVKVREYISPWIKLNGEEIVYINLNETYVEPGYEVSDNYDTDLDNKVVITSYLNVTKVGEYKIEYKVIDSSGNEQKVNRIVIVK